jgi:hypothetical protein
MMTIAGKRGSEATARQRQGNGKATARQQQGDRDAKAIGYGLSLWCKRRDSRLKREGEVREVFISTPSFVLEVNVNASAMQFDSDDEGRHDIGVVKLEWTGRVRGASSLVTKVDIVVAVNEEVVASAASTTSPSSLSCIRGIDGGVAHGRWQPVSIHAIGRLRAAGGRARGQLTRGF